jgi:hypothetical protein
MRVKLSYTIDADNVLREAAKILNLSGDDMQHCIGLFNKVQEELRGDASEDEIVNIQRTKEMITEFRDALLSMDTRLMEVAEIVAGYQEYQDSRAASSYGVSDVPKAEIPTKEEE